MSKSEKNIKHRYQSLKAELARHEYLYHVLDKPEISDFEYDQLFSELLKIESENPDFDRSDSSSLRVGGKPLDAFEKVPHRVPMVSLTNSYSPEDITDFDQRLKKFLKNDSEIEYFCEPKFDGLAIELIYENGVLVRALTRGDGLVGEDVTANVKTIKSIPLRLHSTKPPALVEVRGEIIMHKSEFADLNEQQQENGAPVFANPRNAAAGTIRQLDSKIAAQRKLSFYAYALGAVEGITFSSQEKTEDQFEKWQLPVAPNFKSTSLRQVCRGPEAVIVFYHRIEKIRAQLPFDIDGIVIKVNSQALQDDLGMIARSPRWATAAKYKPEQAISVVENIIIQVGRTGALTPVALLKPTRVGGVVISNATLHNQEEIQRKDIRVGDTVVIQRAGDVIPEVVEVVLKERKKNAKAFEFPSECPACGTKAEKPEEEVVYRCANPQCPAKIVESLKHFVARRAMNLDKIGDRLIETLCEKGLVKSFSDLYRLKYEQLIDLERQGEKSVENILNSIEKSKTPTLARFIYSLGIRFVGEQTAKSLAEHFSSIDRFLEANEEELTGIPDIGPKVAQSIGQWLKDKKSKSEVKDLIKLGVQIQNPKRNTEGPLSGLSFVITGTLPVKRDEAKDFIEANGGKILSGVSAKLNYLVAGDDPGSKIEKAQSLGVQTIDWAELQLLLKK